MCWWVLGVKGVRVRVCPTSLWSIVASLGRSRSISYSCSSRNSPVFSPALESGKGALELPEIVREWFYISRFFDLSSKPGLSPESPVSPRNPAGRQITSPKRGGGVLATRPRDARAVERNVQGDEKLPLSSLTRTQQSIEPVCFRRPVRNDHARLPTLHWETAGYYYLPWLVTCSFS